MAKAALRMPQPLTTIPATDTSTDTSTVSLPVSPA